MQNPRTNRGRRLSFRLISIVGVLLGTIVCAAIRDSKSHATAQDPADVVRVRTDLVAVPLIVTDSRGRRIPGLNANEFALADDDHPRKIDYFASGAERVALLFALDVSGSTRDILAQQHEAATALLSRFGQGSRIAVLHFANFVRLSVPFTSDSVGAAALFKIPAEPTSGTAIFDGAAAAVRSFDGSGGFSTERRIVILMSDGLDTLSSTSYAAVIEAAQTRGVSFYVIHFLLFTPRNGRLEPRAASKGFRQLAQQTGGHYFRIGDARSALNPRAHYDLAPIFQAIEDDLRSQYILGFYPGDTARDGRAHQLAVSLKGRVQSKLRVLQLKTSYSLND